MGPERLYVLPVSMAKGKAGRASTLTAPEELLNLTGVRGEGLRATYLGHCPSWDLGASP